MKKLIIVILLLSGCSYINNADKQIEKHGVAKSQNIDGTYKIVEVTIKDNKLIDVYMDETNAKSADGMKTGTKKELKDDYGMKSNSMIGKEWYEQIEELEKFIVTNGVEEVKLNDEGKVVNEDLISGCSINVREFITLTKEAINNAK